MTDTWKNKLYFGDNLEILRGHVNDESDETVDPVYLTPPFNSNVSHNVLLWEKSGSGFLRGPLYSVMVQGWRRLLESGETTPVCSF